MIYELQTFQLIRTLTVEKPVKFMLSFVEILVVVDVENNLRVISVGDGIEILSIPPVEGFEVTALAHPATYLNKVVFLRIIMSNFIYLSGCSRWITRRT